MTFRLITCDGGGIRGYITSSLILALNTETNGKLLESADGFAGTSTGGLISIALGAGVDIKEVQKIYATQAAEIFTKNYTIDTEQRAKELALAGPGILGCTYTATGLTKIMTSYSCIGDRTFGDLAGGKMVAAVTAQLDDRTASPAQWRPVTFSNKGQMKYSKVKLIDACLATSAAPAYFPPHEVPGMGFFADGGTFANDPALNAIELARQAQLVAGHAEVEVISFGTGLVPIGIPPSAIHRPLTWGATTWLWPSESNGVPPLALLNLALSLSSSNITWITAGLLGDSLVRINPRMSRAVQLDDYSKADYTVMDKAIEAVKATQDWEKARKMVERW